MQYYFSLIKYSLIKAFDSANIELRQASEKTCSALWTQTGEITINSTVMKSGNGGYIAPAEPVVMSGTAGSIMLRFIISSSQLNTDKIADNDTMRCEVIYSNKVNVESTTHLLRLDQVDFPPAAVAYKHTHPGPGIRYLVDGGLTLTTDHDEKLINRGEAWFEEANSPVIATAIDTAPSQFVRAMLLPLEYEGISTFTLCDKTDADKPRRQTNTKHVEKHIDLNDLL